MAESQEAKTLSLSEQYALKEKDEKVDSDTKPVEVKEVETPEEQPSVPAAEPDATASAVEESSASESAPVPAVSEETTETAAPEESSDNTETSAAAEEVEAEAEAEEEPAAKEVPELKLETAPADPRFPTTNQTRHCFTRYVEYHRCVAAKGEGAPECDKFQKYYRSLCPGEWVERWNEQRENGTFPGPL